MNSEKFLRFVEKAAREVLLCLLIFPFSGFAAEPTIDITATSRYPWNGKVDLKFTIAGTSGTKYDTSFTAKDVAGGTNLTLKTLYKSDGTAANVGKEQLLPGTYNWMWDATADLTSRWPSYASCVPTSRTVLFKDTQLAAIAEFYAVPCGTPGIFNKSNRVRDSLIKSGGAGKSVQFAFSDDKYTKCVCVHFEQSGADVVGYVKWARSVTGLGRENEDFDENSATTQTIATSETTAGYGLCKMEARVPRPDASVVLDRVVVEGNVNVSVYYVKFNANGGTGTMANEEFSVGVAKALTANAFKRAGYTFQGWATSASGAKVYSDKQSVTDLTAGGNTLNLYAVWTLGGVQLWENGPYWAECNVGATKPEEYGYYFWWGDTVGYKRNASNNGWVSVKDGKSFSFSEGNCPTYNKTVSQLKSGGYIGSTGNLVAKYDAATVHLGAPWRMPTAGEIDALLSKCTTSWTTRNGVYGRLIKGKGDYSSKSIFLPAAGDGCDSYLYYLGSGGSYWSSTPDSDISLYAWGLYFHSGYFDRNFSGRVYGWSIHPVRDVAK